MNTAPLERKRPAAEPGASLNQLAGGIDGNDSTNPAADVPPAEHRNVEWLEYAADDDKSAAAELEEIARERKAAMQSSEYATGPDIETTDEKGRPRKQADILVDIGHAHSLFHDPGGECFSQVWTAGHREVHAIESKDYREFLARSYWELVGKGANRNGLNDAVVTLSAAAKFEGPERPVWMRVADDGGSVVIDLGGADWRVIRVTTQGWTVDRGGKIAFRRNGKMHALPEPVQGGDFNKLWHYLPNVKEHDRPLIAGFLLSALRPGRPYPCILLSGEQGSGKSTLTKMLKALIDPSAAPLRAPPRDSRDLLVGALNSWLLCIDNLSYLPPQLSDSLCRIATGGGISERSLYTNLDETLVEVMRPAILNGIDELANRPDLAQRGLHIELERIDSGRQAESDLWPAFYKDAPAILGGLLDALVIALRDVDNVHVHPLPRMADFARWSAAGLPALGFSADEFASAYAANQSAGMRLGLDSSPAGLAVVAMMGIRTTWTGTASELLDAIEANVSDDDRRSKAWPKSPEGLSKALNRLAPALRCAGIDFTRGERGGDGRSLTLTRERAPDRHDEQPATQAVDMDDDREVIDL